MESTDGMIIIYWGASNEILIPADALDECILSYFVRKDQIPQWAWDAVENNLDDLNQYNISDIKGDIDRICFSPEEINLLLGKLVLARICIGENIKGIERVPHIKEKLEEVPLFNLIPPPIVIPTEVHIKFLVTVQEY